MDRRPEDPEIEDRITMEIVVDAYGPEEQAIGWFAVLDERLAFPFAARCVAERSVSPLRQGEEVTVVAMADDEDCMREMMVLVEWQGRRFGVPLMQLEAVDPDPDTEQAVGDWHYWVERGYQLG